MQYSVLDDELLFVSSKKQEFYSSERREMENSSFNRLTVSFLFFFLSCWGENGIFWFADYTLISNSKAFAKLSFCNGAL